MWKMVINSVGLLLLMMSNVASQNIYASELFSYKVQPKLFNWTFQGLTEQFRYRPTLIGKPDLPSWLSYSYESSEYHAGFLYGTPPDRLVNTEVNIEIVALNKQNFETRKIILNLTILEKVPQTKNLVQMKIDNLNWVHLMDPGRIENLKNIFRNELWPRSRPDLKVIFMESAIKMGARRPLRPQEREGVFVQLGSNANFSERLLELQKEVRPLYKITSCTYKRTSVQFLFENAGFSGVDWCAFKIIEDNDMDVTIQNHNIPGSETLKRLDRWEAVARYDVPERNYSDEMAFSIAIPGILFALITAILIVILCFQHESMEDDNSEFFFSTLFIICTDFFSGNLECRPPTVQMVQYNDSNNQPTTTLRSLKDTPHHFLDNISMNSQSPCNSLYRENSPRSNSYLRPKPPPYKPASNSSIVYESSSNGIDI